MLTPYDPLNTTHPVELFRDLVRSNFETDLPKGVSPIPRWCVDPQFFPGGTGMPTAESWDLVTPGSSSPDAPLPASEGRDVMVLGNFQATVDSFQKMLEAPETQFKTTWRGLRKLLGDVPPTRTFLTNVHIGLSNSRSVTAPFPTSPNFLQRCRILLLQEIRTMRPSTVVCLGRPASEMLASISSGLEDWAPWPGFEALGFADRQSARGSVSLHHFTAVTVRHPSAILSATERSADATLIAQAFYEQADALIDIA